MFCGLRIAGLDVPRELGQPSLLPSRCAPCAPQPLAPTAKLPFRDPIRDLPAGGYPKKPCSRYCSEQSPSYAYTPPGVYPQMATFYGPWGLPRGQYPTGYSVEVPATCSWSETHTTQITRLRLVTDNLGHEHPSPWVSPHDVMVGEVPFEPSQLGAIELEVSVRSDQDPDLVGADLTQGCNLQPGEPYRCFGTSAGQNMSRGVGLLLLGLLLIGLAIFGCWQLAQVSGKSLF